MKMCYFVYSEKKIMAFLFIFKGEGYNSDGGVALKFRRGGVGSSNYF